MAKKRRSSLLQEPPPGSTEAFAHGVKVMFESIERQLVGLRQGQEAMERRLRAEFSARFDAIERKLDLLEAAVRVNSQDIAALRRELEKTNSMLARKAEESALAALEKRVAALEARLGASS